jgi:hypothetical protein
LEFLAVFAVCGNEIRVIRVIRGLMLYVLPWLNFLSPLPPSLPSSPRCGAANRFAVTGQGLEIFLDD